MARRRAAAGLFETGGYAVDGTILAVDPYLPGICHGVLASAVLRHADSTGDVCPDGRGRECLFHVQHQRRFQPVSYPGWFFADIPRSGFELPVDRPAD